MKNTTSKIISISVPPALHAFIEHRLKYGNYSSTSEYFRDLLRMDQQREIERIEEARQRNAMQSGSQPQGSIRRNY